MSVTRRGKGYIARYRDDTGREHSKMFARKIDGSRWEVEEKAKVQAGTWLDPRVGRVTFRAYAEEWLPMQPLRPTTRAKYEAELRLHIFPAIGDRPLTAVRSSHVQAMAAGLSTHLCAAVVRSTVVLTSSIFKAAIIDRRLAINPCTGVKRPSIPKRKVEIPTTEEVLTLADAMRPEWRSAVILCASTGLRQGELLGLTVDRVNFLKRTLTVDRQMMNLPGSPPAFAPVKTASSNRVLPLPEVALQALSAHLAAFPAHRDGLIYPPITRQLFSKIWRSASVAARLELTVHSLRHYYASLLIQAGESVKTVQERLGHSSAVMTLDLYSHLWPESDDRTRAAVDGVLGQAAEVLRNPRTA